jgi:CRISPR-associated endonuclease Csn1
MIERILGIDLGIASLGWAVIEFDKENDANNKIVDCGVRLFTAAETPKEKESPNKARREARGIRRVIKRRRVRMNEIKNLCIANGLLNENDFDLDEGIYNSKANRTDVWKLRHDALHHTLGGGVNLPVY